MREKALLVAQRPRKPLSNSLWIILTLIFASFYCLNPTNWLKDNSYALCSPRGKQAIYTVDAKNTISECVLIKGEWFSDIGSLWDLKRRNWGFALFGRDTRYIPHGSVVIPGMTDSHVHGLYYGLLKQLPLGGTDSVKETVLKVRQFVESDPYILANKSAFIQGFGWDHTKWGRWPTAADLDADPVLKGRPIALQTHDAHGFWISNTLMAEMDIPDEIEGGLIYRDDAGSPTGVFMDNARELIPIPEPNEETLLARWAYTVNDCWKNGFIGVHDALLSPETIDFFHKQAKNNNIGLRVYGMKEFDLGLTGYWGNTTEKIIRAGNDRFTVRSAKIVGDGALRSGGAALYEPYSDNPSSRGFFRVGPEILNEYIPKFIADGWQTNVHAIGDRTNGAVLDALEEALGDSDVKKLRPRLEHAQIMKDIDVARMGKIGVIASVQPSHVVSDMWYAESRLGSRINTLYPFHSLSASGALLTLGSDFPVEEMSPMYGIYAAITRLSLDGTSPNGPGGFFPEQRLSREEALRGYTINPAYASFSEDIGGSVEVGKRADYVVLDRDFMHVGEREVADVKVLATAMDGVLVYGEF